MKRQCNEDSLSQKTPKHSKDEIGDWWAVFHDPVIIAVIIPFLYKKGSYFIDDHGPTENKDIVYLEGNGYLGCTKSTKRVGLQICTQIANPFQPLSENKLKLSGEQIVCENVKKIYIGDVPFISKFMCDSIKFPAIRNIYYGNPYISSHALYKQSKHGLYDYMIDKTKKFLYFHGILPHNRCSIYIDNRFITMI